MKPSSPREVATVPFFLTFQQPLVEAQFVADYSAKARTHDLQAAAIYLSMVASGSLLYLIITAAGVKATTVDCCLSLIVCSWLGPAAHLGLLWLLPHNVYQQHRAMITLGFRLFYLLATSVNGFGVCGVGPIGSLSLTSKSVGTELQLESPMSAFLWRSGIIGLIWYAGAFPLLFWQHALVQTGFLVAYWRSLTPLVCSTISRVQFGPEGISTMVSAARVLWAHMLAAQGVPVHASQALEAAAAQHAWAGSGSYSSCMQGLGFLQMVSGHALPSFVIYCTEVRTRQRWLAQRRQRQQELLLRTSSAGSSSNAHSSGSNASSTGGQQLPDSSSNLAELVGSLDMPDNAAPTTAAGVRRRGVAATDANTLLGVQQEEDRWQHRNESRAPVKGSDALSSRSPRAGSSSSYAAATAASVAKPSTPAARNSCSAVAGVKAAAVRAGRSLVKRTSSWCRQGRHNSSGIKDVSSSGQQQLLLDLPPLDAFDIESSAGHLPPSFPEVYMLLLAVGMAWFGLGCLV